MKSILHQLTKYSNTGKPGLITEPSEIMQVPSKEESPVLVCLLSLVGKETFEELSKSLYDFEMTPEINKLYPLEIALIYHFYYKHKIIIASEEYTNNILNNFIREQDQIKYRDLFENSVSKTVKDIVMARVAMATYPTARPTPLDILPEDMFRAAALKFLGLNNDATIKHVADKLEKLSTSPNDIILGRLGYLMVWHWHNNKLPEIADKELLGLKYKYDKAT